MPPDTETVLHRTPTGYTAAPELHCTLPAVRVTVKLSLPQGQLHLPQAEGGRAAGGRQHAAGGLVSQEVADVLA